MVKYLRENDTPQYELSIRDETLVCCDPNGAASITVPEGIVTVMSYAFNGCKRVEEVIFSDGLEDINTEAFANCYSLRRVMLPPTIYYIGPYSFENCYLLEEINFPEGLFSIDRTAFN